MRIALAIVLISMSFAAQAVDVTITLTAAQSTRFAAACGQTLRLVDAQKQPRACTLAESKAFLIEQMKQIVLGIEAMNAAKTAADTANAQAFTPQ